MSTTGEVEPNASQKMSRLIKDEAGVYIEPHLLRLFIRSNWAKVSKLAHIIHEEPTP